MTELLYNGVFAIWKDRKITQRCFFSHVVQLSQQLPNKRFGINLCEDRYLFCVSFLALIYRNQINLLPHNQTSNAINSLLMEYSSSYCIVDRPDLTNLSESMLIDAEFFEHDFDSSIKFEQNQTAAIAFTSGSTDKPKATIKTWGTFLNMASSALQQFPWSRDELIVISTVPPQHMYGLETSLFWPLCSSMIVHHQRLFFPEDIRSVIAQAPQKCLLVTTPTHLKACATMDLAWKNVAAVLSSTAPLTRELAVKVEQQFQAPCYEIFGSTETLSYASRRVTADETWLPYSGFSLSFHDNICYLSASNDSQIIALDDVFELHDNARFSVLGRQSDLIKIAGKRSSLTFLNLKLNSINGVDDGLFLVAKNSAKSKRLGALVVTRLSKNTIFRELRQAIDEVFLPRPLLVVNHIPRNNMGKVIKSEIENLLSELHIANDF